VGARRSLASRETSFLTFFWVRARKTAGPRARCPGPPVFCAPYAATQPAAAPPVMIASATRRRYHTHEPGNAQDSVSQRLEAARSDDRDGVFDCDAFRRWARRKGIRPPPYGAVGGHGRTPNVVYQGRFPANRQPTIEPRPVWPRASPSASPWALVAGKPGQRFDTTVSFHRHGRHLPVVSLRPAA
jgi:hypothetical protein